MCDAVDINSDLFPIFLLILLTNFQPTSIEEKEKYLIVRKTYRSIHQLSQLELGLSRSSGNITKNSFRCRFEK